MVFYLFEPVSLRQLVDGPEEVIEVADDLGWPEPLRPGREVDHVGEQHRGRPELVRDRLGLSLQLVGDRPRQDVEQKVFGLGLFLSERPSAPRRGWRRRASSVNMMVPPTAMFSASIALLNELGTATRSGRGSRPYSLIRGTRPRTRRTSEQPPDRR